jgi:hypothetical protein
VDEGVIDGGGAGGWRLGREMAEVGNNELEEDYEEGKEKCWK